MNLVNFLFTFFNVTPPCPNCGTVYSVSPPDAQGWSRHSIAVSTIFEDKLDGSPTFFGHEYVCNKCGERWRAPVRDPYNHLAGGESPSA